jgi:hypothetical protein
MPQTKAARFWFRMTVVSFTVLAAVTLVQVSSFTQDLDRTCEAAGQPLDLNYRLRHEREGTLDFPLHNRCNHLYDTVPDWVNPVLAILAAVLAIALTGALVTHGAKRPEPVGLPSRRESPHPVRKAHRAPSRGFRRIPRQVPSRQ